MTADTQWERYSKFKIERKVFICLFNSLEHVSVHAKNKRGTFVFYLIYLQMCQ